MPALRPPSPFDSDDRHSLYGRIAVLLLVGMMGFGILGSRPDAAAVQAASTLDRAGGSDDAARGSEALPPRPAPPVRRIHASEITSLDAASDAAPGAPWPPLSPDTGAIDPPPTLRFSTYLGGREIDLSTAIAVDQEGAVYIAGQTLSDDFPTQSAFQPYQGGPLAGADAFVAKLSPDGDSLLYATYLGGSLGEEIVSAMTVDEQGRVYVAGTTTSMDFPTQNALHGFRPGSQLFADAFVARLSPDGSSLEFSTYLGGTGDETATGLALGEDGSLYVTGTTTSTNFPTTPGVLQTDRHGDAASPHSDAFVVRLAAAGGGFALDYATYLGGARDEIPNALAVDDEGRAWVAGGTTSLDFPLQNALQSAYGGPIRNLEGDAFVARLSTDASSLDLATYLGGTQDDQATGLALDEDGRVVVTGTTMSNDFPTTPGTYQPGRQALRERFVAWLEPTGGSGSLAASTRLGAPGGFETGRAGLTVDPAGRVWIGGATGSSEFPTQDPAQSVFGGGESDAFLVRIDETGQKLGYATFLGGREADVVTGLAVGEGVACVTGGTGSSDFPVQQAVQRSFDGPPAAGRRLTSAFVTCFDISTGEEPIPVALAAFNAAIDRGAVLLTWTPAAGTSPTGFEVQQRPADDPDAWTALAFVESTGTTAEPQSYRFRVTGLSRGVHLFRLKQISIDGTAAFSQVVEVDLGIPARFAVYGAYPNPSDAVATVPFDVAETTTVRLTLYDLLGRKQAVLLEKEYEPGRHEVQYDGRRWASGTYFLVMEMGDFREAQQVVLLR